MQILEVLERMCIPSIQSKCILNIHLTFGGEWSILLGRHGGNALIRPSAGVLHS